jgi:hypothetical protein
VRSAEAIEAESLPTLTAEVARLNHQVAELQHANAMLREALSRVQMRLIPA